MPETKTARPLPGHRSARRQEPERVEGRRKKTVAREGVEPGLRARPVPRRTRGSAAREAYDGPGHEPLVAGPEPSRPDLHEHNPVTIGADPASLEQAGEPLRRGEHALPVPGTGRAGRSTARRVRSWALTASWLLVTAAAAFALGLGWTRLAHPSWVPTAGAVVVTTSYTYALTARTGGRPLLSGFLALLAATLAVLLRTPVLLSGAAVMTAVVAAVLGVMATTPAARFLGVLRETLVAVLVTVVGAFAVEAYQPEVSLARVGYVVLGLSLLMALGLVYRLGAGFHGLGNRGTITVVSGVVLLGVSLLYTEALARWGSPGVAASIDSAAAQLRAAIHAVPRPIEVLVGFPALAWGVSTRARRRQGWWVSAFGAAGLAVVAVSLLNPDTTLVETGLSLSYSAVLGLGLGYLVIRADRFLTGTRGRRARRLEEAAAHRPEPGRTQSLL